jgi:tRNA nucleotidyltransferase/poly(A) polymerase
MIPSRRTAREAAVNIVRILRDAGYVAYLAGGCVRDALLGLEPKDYDVATDARPEAVRKLFQRSRYVGESFGVVLVYVGGHPIEVATFRSEWGYEDGRRPTRVHFTDAEHDAQRRDFTINGLFADPLQRDGQTGGDRIIDFVGGRADLQARLVRAIGDPQERFAEDYLRMLRAVRFAARLDFQIEGKTAAAIRPSAKYLGQISRERIGQEVQWMLTGARPALAAWWIQQLRLDSAVLNEDHLDVEAATLRRLSAEAQFPTALAAWMIDRQVGPATLEAAEDFVEHRAEVVVPRWRTALCLSNDDRDGLRAVLSLLAQAHRWPQLKVAQRKRLLAKGAWGQTMLLLHALADAAPAREIDQQSRALIAEGVAPPPLVTGEDLIALGLAPGPVFGQLLDQVYDAQLEGRVTTRDQALGFLNEHTPTP